MRESTETLLQSALMFLLTAAVWAIPPHGWIDLVAAPCGAIAAIYLWRGIKLRRLGQ